eukprot:6179872-Pleurochrysis_carterae.AAC.1
MSCACPSRLQATRATSTTSRLCHILLKVILKRTHSSQDTLTESRLRVLTSFNKSRCRAQPLLRPTFTSNRKDQARGLCGCHFSSFQLLRTGCAEYFLTVFYRHSSASAVGLMPFHHRPSELSKGIDLFRSRTTSARARHRLHSLQRRSTSSILAYSPYRSM